MPKSSCSLSSLRRLLLSLVAFAGVARSDAAIVFYHVNIDEAAFAEAISDAELTLLGRESFDDVEPEHSDVTPQFLLAPGVSAGSSIPTGTSVELGMMIQTNADGAHPAAPSPGGLLYVSRSSEADGPGWVGPNLASDGLDLIVDPPGYRGQARALAFDVNISGGNDFVVKLLDNTNTVIAEHNFVGLGQERIAVMVTDQSLFRVNLFASSGFFDVREIDVYLAPITLIPEPSVAVPLAGILALCVVLLRRPTRR